MKPETKNLPQSLEAEKLILSSLMHDRVGNVIDSCSKLRPEHFYSRSNSIIFACMQKLASEEKGTDLVTVINFLKSNSQMEQVGGEHEIMKLFKSYVTSAHTEDHIEILLEKHRGRKIIEICELGTNTAYRNEDSQECISKIEQELFSLSTDKNEKDNQKYEAYEEVKRMIEVRKSGKEVTGLMSGIKPVDDIFFGFQKGQYYVLAGRPSSGKTAMADQICGNLLMRDKCILYISLESDRERVFSKLACKLANVAFWDFKRNLLRPELLLKVEQFNDILVTKNIILMRPFDISPMEIRPLIRRCKRSDDIDLVIMDYLQKINIPNGWDERRTVSRSSTEIQRACVESGVPALIVAQLNREAKDNTRPYMSHLKESGQIEQDADNIAMIWSPTDKRDLAEGDKIHPCLFTVEKNKDGASSLDIEIDFELDKLKFHPKPILTRTNQRRESP